MTKPTKPAKQQRYPAEVKSHAQARWLAGDSLRQIAEAVGAPKTTVARWVKDCDRSQHIGQQVVRLSSEVGQKSVREDDPPVVDIARIAARLVDGNDRALEAITELIATGQGSDWLKGQSAGELALLFGVISDKHFRVLSAYRPIDPEVGGGV